MEFVFLLVAILLTVFMTYVIGRLVHSSHQSLIRAYKRSEFLVITHLVFGAMLTLTIFMALCAFNNSIWHLPYLTK